MNFIIAFLALLSIPAAYTEVAGMKGSRYELALRLIPPVAIYIMLFLSFTYVPVLHLWSILAWLLYFLGRSAIATYNGYRQSQLTDPPTTAEWLRTLRFVPHLMGGLLIVYVVTAMLGKVQGPVQTPPADYQPNTEAIQSKPTTIEIDAKTRWDSLGRINP